MPSRSSSSGTRVSVDRIVGECVGPALVSVAECTAGVNGLVDGDDVGSPDGRSIGY